MMPIQRQGMAITARQGRIGRYAQALLLTALFAPSCAQAEGFFTYDHGLVQTSLWTTHYSSDDDDDEEYNNQQNLIGVEVHNPERWFTGAAWLKTT